MYTDESLTGSGPINLESRVISILCVTYIFFSACEENSDKQINSTNKSSRELSDQLFGSPYLGSMLLIVVLLFQDNCHSYAR